MPLQSIEKNLMMLDVLSQDNFITPAGSLYGSHARAAEPRKRGLLRLAFVAPQLVRRACSQAIITPYLVLQILLPYRTFPLVQEFCQVFKMNSESAKHRSLPMLFFFIRHLVLLPLVEGGGGVLKDKMF